MKRHPGLHPLSQHHHFALIQALEMRRATEAPGEKRQDAVERQAEKFLRFWHKTGKVHFREEEEVLLPEYARHARLDQDSDVIRVFADHAEIRATVRDFELWRETHVAIPVDAMAHLAKLLHDHVRLEENELFPRIEEVLGEERLNAIGARLTRLHYKDDVCDV